MTEIYGQSKLQRPVVTKEEVSETKQYDVFILVKKDKKVHIAFTNKIISTKIFKSFKEAEKYIDEKPWELLINTSCAVFEIIVKENINNNKQ